MKGYIESMDFKEKYKQELKAIPLSTKQKILDLLWSGLSIGECCKALNMSTLHVSGVICENIKDVKVLSKKAK